MKRQTIGLIIGLSLQYLLGMINNLFVKFPDSNDQQTLWEFARSQPTIVLHVLLALGLLLGSSALLALSVKMNDTRRVATSMIGFLGILLATFSGVRFIPTQSDQYSFLMSLGFIISVLAYIYALIGQKNIA